MFRTSPYLAMKRVFMARPILAGVVQLISIPALGICADIRAKIVDNMCSAKALSKCISGVIKDLTSMTSLLDRPWDIM